jgi:hypothetical protein
MGVDSGLPRHLDTRHTLRTGVTVIGHELPPLQKWNRDHGIIF